MRSVFDVAPRLSIIALLRGRTVRLRRGKSLRLGGGHFHSTRLGGGDAAESHRWTWLYDDRQFIGGARSFARRDGGRFSYGRNRWTEEGRQFAAYGGAVKSGRSRWRQHRSPAGLLSCLAAEFEDASDARPDIQRHAHLCEVRGHPGGIQGRAERSRSSGSGMMCITRSDLRLLVVINLRTASRLERHY